MLQASRLKEVMTAEVAFQTLRLLPYLPDQAYLYFLRPFLRSFPVPESREFMQRLVLFAKKHLTLAAPTYRDKAIETFFINALLKGYSIRRQREQELGIRIPFFFVISPTMRCNLGCYGCYAGMYTKEDDLDYTVVDRILKEAKDLGIYFITISGGEPFYWQHILEMFQAHNDMFFQVYTNGTLIDQTMAEKLAKLGNVLPAISVEGFEKETDDRRGKGTFQKIINAMQELRKAGVLFGFSCTVTRENNEFVVSDEFVDFYEKQGCFLGWYFNYVPIGKRPALELMPTPEQRIHRINRLAELRKTKSILLADFWNDGNLVGGCIAGGRNYLHINSHGDVEPCVFVHFATDNIKNKSLVEVLKSPLFAEIRKRQPYSHNHYRPCMIIDNPEVLREIVEKTGAYPTHPGAETVVTQLRHQLDEYANQYGALANIAWERCRKANVQPELRRN
ncbi:MAG: radical SAM protein [bacterium]|nr:radical SAM protein [bacterium]